MGVVAGPLLVKLLVVEAAQPRERGAAAVVHLMKLVLVVMQFPKAGSKFSSRNGSRVWLVRIL